MIRRLVVVAGVAIALAGCGPTTTASWNMNETTGRTMNDGVGNHDGTASASVLFNQAGRNGTRAYAFNGTDSIVRVPHAADLNPGTGDFSFGAAVNFTELPPPSNWDVIRKGVDGNAGGYYKLEVFLGVSGGARARCFFRDGDGTQISVVRGTGLSDGQWHLLTCSRTGGNVSIKVDSGTSSNPVTGLGSIANTAELTVGAQLPGGDFFKGRIDDAQVST